MKPYRLLWDGQTFDHAGRTFRVNLEPDQFSGAPWKECDGHGIIREARAQYGEKPAKRAGERVLYSDRWNVTLYDFAGTLERARRDCWGLGEDALAKLTARLGRAPTKREITAESVERDFAYCYAWANDQWQWMSVSVVLLDHDGNETQYQESCGGVDNFDDGSAGGAWAQREDGMPRELANECIARQRADADEIRFNRRCERAQARVEARERSYWAARGVETRP
jgi:hypothetical protein